MRRKDRELTDKVDLETILQSAVVCRVAFNDVTAPYIVPLNYGYDWKEKLLLYFHSANQGKKLNLISADSNVGFELDMPGEFIKGDKACDWGMKYQSLIGKGKAEIMEDKEEKKEAMDAIMRHYGYNGKPEYGDQAFKHMAIYKIVVDEITGKRKG